MMGNIIGGFCMIVLAMVLIILFIEFIKNTFGLRKHTNMLLINIKRFATDTYCVDANDYIKHTLRDLGIKFEYEYDDFICRMDRIDIKHEEYGELYSYRRRGDDETMHDEFVQIYKDINNVFEEGSRIASKEDASAANKRLEQMASYHRDTYQITKKMNS